MDQSDRAKELSEKTGLTVDPCLELHCVADPDNTYYYVWSTARNVACTIRVPDYLQDDPQFDLPSYIQREMDRCCDWIQARMGHEGWQVDLPVVPTEDIDT